MHTSCSSTSLHILLYTGHSPHGRISNNIRGPGTLLIYSKTCRGMPRTQKQNSRVEQGARNLGEEHHWHARSRLAPALTPLRLPELADSEEHQFFSPQPVDCLNRLEQTGWAVPADRNPNQSRMLHQRPRCQPKWGSECHRMRSMGLLEVWILDQKIVAQTLGVGCGLRSMLLPPSLR